MKETLDDMAAGRDNPKYECEVCGKFVCVFCGAACACCNDVRTCRECAETYENFTFCESCKLAYCNDGDEYGDESDCDKDIVYCSECDRFRCSDDCQNVIDVLRNMFSTRTHFAWTAHGAIMSIVTGAVDISCVKDTTRSMNI